MTVGVGRISLRIRHSQSLKAKRQVVRSVVARVRDRYSVSISETDDLDAWQMATLGFACVSNDERHANEMLTEIIGFIERMPMDAEILDIETELIHAF